MLDSASGLLGLAARAKKLSTGDVALAHVRSKDARLLILAQDIGGNSKKKLLDKCEYYHVPIVYMNADTMNRAIGTTNRKFVAVLDEGFAQKLSTCLKG